jgi:AraC-like DNA-binding protein
MEEKAITEGAPQSAGADLRVSLAGTDTDKAVTDLSGMYAGKSWHSAATEQRYWYRYVGVGGNGMSIRRSQMSGSLRGDVATEDEVVVQWIETGTARILVGNTDEIRMQPGRPTLFPTNRRFNMDYQDWDQRLVHIDRSLLQDVAAEALLPDGPVELDHRSVPSDAAIARWRTAVSDAMRVLKQDGVDSLAWHEVTRRVARILLEMYPPCSTDVGDALAAPRNAKVRAAIDYLHAHVQEPITISALAEVAGLSNRALQQSFRRTVEQSPMAYLRDVRLGRVHEELQQSEPKSSNVGSVARSWGFTHMGRFSADYAKRFGEYPSETLRS